VSFEKVQTFEDLKEFGVIEIESENRTGEDPPEGFKKAFLASMKSILNPLPHFSKPPNADSSGWSIGFSSSEIVDVQNIDKQLDLNMIISEPMLRKVFIQGVPIGLDEALKDLNDIEIPVGENFKQDLTVRCMSNFNNQPLTAVNVKISNSINFVFDENNPREKTINLVHDPIKKNDYKYKYHLYFNQTYTNQTEFESEYFTIDKDIAFLDIQPENFFSNRSFNVTTTSDFPWDLINSVEVKLNVDDNASVLNPESIRIDSKMPSGLINAFAIGKQYFEDVSYSAVFTKSSDNSTFSLTAYPTGRMILLNQLQKRRITFLVLETGNWKDYESVQIVIKNDQNKIQIWKAASNKMILNKSSPMAHFDYWFAGNDRSITYKIRFISKYNGNTTPEIVESEGLKIQISIPNKIINT
jgi:hypothetical protein